jgi:hypothetical protein
MVMVKDYPGKSSQRGNCHYQYPFDGAIFSKHCDKISCYCQRVGARLNRQSFGTVSAASRS